MLTIEEKIGILAKRTGISLPQVAERLGCSKQNVYSKLRRKTWTEEELRRYAEIFGCECEVVFTNKQTGERL